MKSILSRILAAIVGHPYQCLHTDPATGKQKWFHCMTYQDAIEWAQAASGLYAVTIIDWQGISLLLHLLRDNPRIY